jgi:Aromatic-ring hydroxylase, C-terminal
VVGFSDRAFSIGTSSNPLVGLLRAGVAPRLAPLVLRSRAGRAFAFRTISQLAIHYRGGPLSEEGRPGLRRGPRAGDRLPDARIERDGQPIRLQEALCGPEFHLLLCGPLERWPEGGPTPLCNRFSDLLKVHKLAASAVPGVLHDPTRQALDRLGVGEAAHYLVRPDGYIGFRAAGTDLLAAESYLSRALGDRRA